MNWKKSTFLLTVLFGLFFSLSAQNNQGFRIVATGQTNNVSEYEQALKKNDLDQYRHLNLRTVLIFESGVEVELLSATEMQELGLQVEMSKVSTISVEEFERQKRNSVFILHPSGRILEKVTPVKKVDY